MITYNVESLASIEAETRGMTFSYLKESASPFESRINWPVYYALEQYGALHVIAVRDDEMLVGFGVLTVTEHHNARGMAIAQELAIYIDPPYRKGRIGIKLLDTMVKQATAVGAKFILITSRGGNLTPLLKHRGFTELETTFVKGLD